MRGIQMKDRLLWSKAKECDKKYNQQQSICKWTKRTMQRRSKGPKFNVQNSEVTSTEIKMRRTTDWQTGMMCKLLSQQSAPNVDIDIFDGNPLEFNYFMSIFEEMAESKVIDLRGRLTRLINYTKREAKELVKHCIQQPTEVCYDHAKNLLIKRYGDPHKILSAHHLEIKKWPQVRQGDATAYRKFITFFSNDKV